MNKIFSRRIKELFSDYDNGEYIEGIKSTIYLVSQLVYLSKFKYKSDIYDSLIYIKENINELKTDDIKIFREYNGLSFKKFDKCLEIINILLDICSEDKNSFHINVASLYESLINNELQKNLGQVYTPDNVINNMIDMIFCRTNLNQNIKILDPACGAGYFLIKLFKSLKYQFKKMNLEISNRDIVEKMLYGADLDKFSVFLCKISLIFETQIEDLEPNIYNKDFLLDFQSNTEFDIIIGNPPYIGHKKISSEYFKALKKEYHDVYYDKADISYCFFMAANNFLKKGGMICFITSRYFIEAKYADKLRKYLNKEFRLVNIVDYNGYRVFKSAVVSPAIILLIKNEQQNNDDSKNSFKSNELQNSSESNNLNKSESYSILVSKYFGKEDGFSNYRCSSSNLQNDKWYFLSEDEQALYNKIENMCNASLKDIVAIKQGIITGFDKAFVVDEKIIKKYSLEKQLLKKWIKNSNISNDKITFENKYLIYTNDIEDETCFPNTISYLEQYKDRLANRRECMKGVRRWFDLQWGRALEIFENEKIVFPYKAKENCFAYDENNYFCSADIYCMILKDNSISYEYLSKYLNSSIFNFFYKAKAKKVGEKLYEYYPNNIENTLIYLPKDNFDKIEKNDDKIYFEEYLEKTFNITDKERKIIQKY